MRKHRNNDIPVSLLAKALRVSRNHPVVDYAWEPHTDPALRWDDEPIPGIYAILDTIYASVYFGETGHLYRRRQDHDRNLRRGTHSNFMLMDACTGIDNERWRFLVLEDSCYSEWRRLERERWWISNVPDCINALHESLIQEVRDMSRIYR